MQTLVILGTPWSRGRVLSRRPGSPGLNPVNFSIFQLAKNGFSISTHKKYVRKAENGGSVVESGKKKIVEA